MSTPQNILYKLEYKINSLVKAIEGSCGDEGNRKGIHERFTGVEIEVSEFNERLEAIEDQLKLVVKLLGKNES